MLAAGFTLLAILITRVQVTLLVGDIASALASADADRVYYEEQLNSCKVSHALAHIMEIPGIERSLMLPFAVWIQYMSVTYRQTDRRTDRQTNNA